MTTLKKLPRTDETWSCHGTHATAGKKEALLIWRTPAVDFHCLMASPTVTAYSDSLKRLVAAGTIRSLPRTVVADAPDVDRLLGRVLGPLGVSVRQVSRIPRIDVCREAADFILGSAARAMVPEGAPPDVAERLHRGLSVLHLDESWLRIPINRSFVVEGLPPEPFGLQVHADCCPGFTVLPFDREERASRREGIVVLRFTEGERHGVFGRWPTAVEEVAQRHPADVFRGPQMRLTPLAADRLEASLDIVLQVGLHPARSLRTVSLRREPSVTLRLRQRDLGVRCLTVSLGLGSQHVRVRAS